MPILYSFRRCPYAIRARLAIAVAEIGLDLYEVSLKNKPQAMLDLSSKGTVPVLHTDEHVIDESLDIMLWALSMNDPEEWLSSLSEKNKEQSLTLISETESDFKPWLDKYKYADRNLEHSKEYYRQHCEPFLNRLESLLTISTFLFGSEPSLADMAIFPFIRQFSMVDKAWFEQCQYPKMRAWLNYLITLPLFEQTMTKREEGLQPKSKPL